MISCNDVRQLLPGYLDGELSEAQAGPARTHMLECCACREQVQDGKVLSRWFHSGQGQPLDVPRGFSARIARRAFAGDTGTMVSGNSRSQDAGRERPILPFLLKMTALAACLLFVLALQIKRQSLPDSHEAEASNHSPPWEVQPDVQDADALLALPAGAPLRAPVKLAPDELDEDGDKEEEVSLGGKER